MRANISNAGLRLNLVKNHGASTQEKIDKNKLGKIIIALSALGLAILITIPLLIKFN